MDTSILFLFLNELFNLKNQENCDNTRRITTIKRWKRQVCS